MSIYSKIYIVITLLIVFYTIWQRLDLLCVASMCFIVYTIYCIPGNGIAGFYRPKLSPMLYYSVYTQLGLILISIILARYKKRRRKSSLADLFIPENVKANNVVKRSFRIYIIVIFLFAFINVFSVGIKGFAAGKKAVWENVNVFYVISLYGAYPAFAYGIHNEDKLVWIPSLLIELSIFFAGSRAFLTTMIVIFLCEKGTSLWSDRKRALKLFVIGGISIVLLLVYRRIDEQIMTGDFAGALNILKDPASWKKSLEFNEPRVIIANYDYVFTSGVRLPFGDVVYRLLDFIPGLTSVIRIKLSFPEYFSDWLMTEVQGSSGVGGTIWGESYAMFGFSGIVFSTLIWLWFINTCNNHLDYHANISYFLVSLGAYLGWYINRLDYNRVAQAFKIMLFCFLVWGSIYILLGGKIKLKTSKIK